MENTLESMQTIFNNMKGVRNLLENLSAGKTSSTREALSSAMKAIGAQSMPELQKMLVEMKRAAESQRSFADDILKDATADDVSSDGHDKNDRET